MIQPDEQLKSFIRQHADDDTHKLLLASSRYPGVDVEFAVRQIEGRRKAKEKFPSLVENEDFIYPVKLSMEQCSSELTAQYKASLVEGLSVVDLTGGLGIDAMFMSAQSAGYCYVERNAELEQIAAHNFSVCGAAVESYCDDGIEFLMKANRRFDCIYIDPARRDGNKNKVIRLGDCEPDVPSALPVLWQYADKILVKASPMLDITQAVKELGCVSRVHVVAVKNECKELLFECRPGAKSYSINCVNLDAERHSSFSFTPEEESQSVVDFADALSAYLYEPNAAIMKAGAFRLTGKRFGLNKLHPDTHLYTSDVLLPDFPGRVFRIVAAGAMNKQTMRENLPDRKANIAVRNFPSKPEEIRKKFGLSDGGSVYLFAVTMFGGKKQAVFCQKN